MSYTQTHLNEVIDILHKLDVYAIEKMAELMAETKTKGGRLFFLGVGGSAANCSHAVNDFRKIAGSESYAPTDNVSEPTARTNDEQWDKSNVLFRNGHINECSKRASRPKMSHIYYGLGVLSPSGLQTCPKNEPSDLADFYHRLSVHTLLAGCEVFERFYKVGSNQGLRETTAYFHELPTSTKFN